MLDLISGLNSDNFAKKLVLALELNGESNSLYDTAVDGITAQQKQNQIMLQLNNDTVDLNVCLPLEIKKHQIFINAHDLLRVSFSLLQEVYDSPLLKAPQEFQQINFIEQLKQQTKSITVDFYDLADFTNKVIDILVHLNYYVQNIDLAAGLDDLVPDFWSNICPKFD